MRISDWSSDVCSSDLLHERKTRLVSPIDSVVTCNTVVFHPLSGGPSEEKMKLFKPTFQPGLVALGLVAMAGLAACGADEGEVVADDGSVTIAPIAPTSRPSAVPGESPGDLIERSEKRPVRKECVSTGR